MPGFDPGLGRVFGFDATDLAANQQGRLSDEQRLIFANAAEMSRRRSPVMLAIFAIAAVGTLVLIVVNASATGSSGGDLLLPLGLAMGMLAFLVLLIWFFRRRMRRDQAVHAAGQVFVVTDTPEYDPTLDGTWRIEMGGAHFGVELLQFEALDLETTYRAYFLGTQPGQTLLSIERV